MSEKQVSNLLALCFIAVVWIASTAVWWASLHFAIAFDEAGADLPQLTVLVVKASRYYVPFIFSFLFTAVFMYLSMRRSRYIFRTCSVMACVAAVYLSVSVVAFALPTTKMCGIMVPTWPQSWGGPQPAAHSAVVESGSC